jgi:cyclopropane fatty-acyl-phospholipid synthase-like methyltransferase
MDITSKLWLEKWSNYKYSPIVENYEEKGMIVGSDPEPAAAVCLSSFAESMKNNFKEGMKLLDYGCGSGRFSNFMSKHLENFEYYGLERYLSDYTKECITRGIILFSHDSRIRFGFTETEFESHAISNADTVLLLSVFTHTTIEETHKIIEKLLPIVNKEGGMIVFSMIHSHDGEDETLNYVLGEDGAYGFSDGYHVVKNTKEQLKEIEVKFGVKIELVDTFNAGWIHSIYSMTK